MRVLQVNKFYRVVGGSERYLFNLSTLLEARGHEVIPFSMDHPDNVATPYARFFVNRIDYYARDPWTRLRAAAAALPRMIWSRHAAERMRALLAEARPDIAHLHMIDHQISPSILPVLRNAGVPVVLTAHQYKLVCPNYRLLNERTNRICERCLDGAYWHPVVERCHKGSWASSAAIALETTLHKRWRVYERYVDIVHAPSRFMGETLARGGIARDVIRHADLTLDLEQFAYAPAPGQGLVFFGRLSAEKGLDTLLAAMRDERDLPLVIVGGGPERERLEQAACAMRLDHVTFVGPQYGDELRLRIAAAAAVVLPSEWYENSPLVIYESFALGRPVIGARIGGIPEYITPGETGFLFAAGDAADLRRALGEFRAAQPRWTELGRNARAFAERRFSHDAHYANIMAIYEEAAARRRKARD